MTVDYVGKFKFRQSREVCVEFIMLCRNEIIESRRCAFTQLD